MIETPSELTPERLARLRDRLRDRDGPEVTTDELAQATGLSRMTLHRRGIGKDVVLAQLGQLLQGEYHQAARWTRPSRREGLKIVGFKTIFDRMLFLATTYALTVPDVAPGTNAHAAFDVAAILVEDLEPTAACNQYRRRLEAA